jgi:hypothetical protein
MRCHTVLFMALLISGSALASEPSPHLLPLPDIPPPPSMFDPDLEPQITIIQRGDDRVEEYRIKGQLYMIKITPPHGRPYFLVDHRGDGQMRKYDDLSPNFQVPLWVIHAF